MGLLTGSLPAAQKRETLAALASGELDLAVGTHALLSEGVRFARLGLVVTDEQHRFGVEQRARLAAKGRTRTCWSCPPPPFPRTLALILYGDLDISVLDELPPGRTPVATYAVGSDKRERAYGYVRMHLDQGRQAYLVCPLVEERRRRRRPARRIRPGLRRCGCGTSCRQAPFGATGGPAPRQNEARGKGAGHDSLLRRGHRPAGGHHRDRGRSGCANAVIMVIENAERFGLAQLHQLRGRVGRKMGLLCILISDAQNEEARRRLKVMCETSDGFCIADEDLKLRGPGDFFRTAAARPAVPENRRSGGRGHDAVPPGAGRRPRAH